jgi:hypothetical protein
MLTMFATITLQKKATPVGEGDGGAGEEVFTVNKIIRHKQKGKKVETYRTCPAAAMAHQEPC